MRAPTYIFVAQLLKLGDVGGGHKPRVGHYYEVLKVVLAHKLIYHRKHRVSFVLVALVNAVGQRIAAQAHQKTEDDLWVAVAAFLRETRLAQVVLTVGLEVECGHVIENNSYVSAEHLHGVMHADVLCHVLVPVIELVEISVNLRQVHVLVKVVLQVLHRGCLASRTAQAAVHKLAEYLVVDSVEPNQVEHTVEYQLAAVEKNVLYARDHTLHLLTLALPRGLSAAI